MFSSILGYEIQAILISNFPPWTTMMRSLWPIVYCGTCIYSRVDVSLRSWLLFWKGGGKAVWGGGELDGWVESVCFLCGVNRCSKQYIDMLMYKLYNLICGYKPAQNTRHPNITYKQNPPTSLLSEHRLTHTHIEISLQWHAERIDVRHFKDICLLCARSIWGETNRYKSNLAKQNHKTLFPY